MFFPIDLSYQDVWLKAQLLTLAYVQAVQYWAEEANPPTSGEHHPLVMSVWELRQCIRRYITFSVPDIFEGLGNTIHEARCGDMGTPLVNSTTSSVMADMEDTQLSPVRTAPVDDTTVLVTEPDPRSKRTSQLPRVLALPNCKLQLLPLWYQWIRWPALPLQLAIQ